MPGTKIGAKKAAATNKLKYGNDFYAVIGKAGGLSPKTKPSGFACNLALASIAGAKGGRKSRRGPAKKDPIDEAERILEEESGRNK